MKKVVLMVMVLALCVFGVSQVKIEFWHAMGAQLGETLNSLVETFNKENPDIQVIPIYVGNYSALNQKLLSTITAYSQGSKTDLPAISQAYANWTAKYLFSNVVEPLNEYIENDPEMKDAWENQIFSVLKDMVTWGDTVYGVPFNKSVYTYYYNTDLFDLFGLEPPKTIDELWEVSETLTLDIDFDGTVDIYGLGVRTFIDDLQIFLYSHNVTFLEYVGEGKYKIILDEQKTKEVLKLIKDLKDSGYAIFQNAYLDQPFGAGEIAAYMGTVAGLTYAEQSSRGKHGVSWAPHPSVDGVPHSPIAGTDLIMFSWITQEQKDAAWRFLKFLMDPVNVVYWSINTGYVPIRRDVVNVPQWQAYTANDVKPTIALNELETAIPDPKPAAWDEIRSKISTIFANFLNDYATIDETYDSMVEVMETLLKESGEFAQ